MNEPTVMDELTEVSEAPQPEPATPAAEPLHGCLTAAVVGVVYITPLILGGLWLLSLLEPSRLHIIVGVLYVLYLALPFSLAAIFLRGERFRLWRGVALALALAGGYALVSGAVLSVDRMLDWPGLPMWVLPLVTCLHMMGAALTMRRTLLHPPALVVVWLGIGLSLVTAIPWVVVGAAGTLIEIWISLLDALSTALIGALLIAALFTFDQDMPARRPLWSAVLAGFTFWALKGGLLAVRGYWLQASIFSPALIPAGFVAGALLTLQPAPDRGLRGCWAAAAYLFGTLAFGFVFTEGFEGEWMADEAGRAWLPGATAWGVLNGVLAVALLATQPLIRRARPAHLLIAGGATSAIGLLILLPLYLIIGQPGLPPEVYFVVMADQADTGFARDIADRDARVTAVYETLVEHASESQADIRAYLDEQGVPYTPYYLVNGLEVEGNPWLRYQLAARPDVAYVLNSPHTRPLPEFAQVEPADSTDVGEPYEANWGVSQMRADHVWADFGVTGEGIIIGHADSGVDWTHPLTRQQYVGGPDDHDYTWFDPWEGTLEPVDTGGHGTTTLGIILGHDGIGVAPGARWIACRNLARNLGNPAYYLDCMQFLFAPFPMDGDPFADGDPLRGAHVSNNSWGCPPQEGCDGETMSLAIEHLRNAGQMFVVSAGNEGPGCGTVGPPANADAAFSVGAIDIGEQVAFFSSRGPVTVDGSGRFKPDVVAPGVEIYSSWPVSALIPDGYLANSGTSMAGPHVTGLVALLWSANPELIGDIDLTEQIIIETAHYVQASDLCGGDDGDRNNVYGYGIVDAYAAVEAALDR